MYFVTYGSIAAILVYAMLSLGGIRDTKSKLIWTAIAFAGFGLAGWLLMPVFAWNFELNWLLLAALSVLVVVIMSNSEENHRHRYRFDDEDDRPRRSPLMWLPLAIGVVVLGPGYFVTTSSVFHADRYHQLLGTPAESEFSEDVSPVDIDQVRRVDQELAKTLGSKRIEEQPGLGSRVDLGTMNIQTIDGCFSILDGNEAEQRLCFDNQLVWAGPLIHAGPIKWFTNGTTPGYVIVSATDASEVHLVTALKSDTDGAATMETTERMGTKPTQSVDFSPVSLRYLIDGAYFGDYVERHVRSSGYFADGLTDYSFEIDNAGRPYWVITHFERTIGFSGEEANGVVVVDIQTGALSYYTVAEAPDWIDRIQPELIVTDQLTLWGRYVQGFLNAFLAKDGVVEPTPGMSLVFGADGNSYWYSGLQSAGADTGTNSFVLVNTRTKEPRRYMVKGTNETSAKSAAENAPGAREFEYKGVNAILYNVAGEATYFVPLKGDDGLVKMYAWVNVVNPQSLGVGKSPQIALRDYQNALIREGQGINFDDLTTQLKIKAVVTDVVQINDTFYLLLEGRPGQEFYGTNDVSPELKWAKAGKEVVVVVEQGTQRSLQLYAFDIPSLDISQLPEDGS